jgi:precorrin-2/cobalt-factor-2 C20-methyltransferase
VLIGLGLGPGDAELLTLRAIRLLKEADVVFVPGRMAYDLVKPYRDAIILDFPMTCEESVIRECMVNNSYIIGPAARNGLAVIGMIGDPNFFSTFTRLCAILKEMYPEIAISTEPGISSITAFTSAADISISGGFIVSDGSEPSSMILLKVKKPVEISEKLRSEGYKEFVLIERMFLEGERVYRNDELPEKSDYFSILYARK